MTWTGRRRRSSILPRAVLEDCDHSQVRVLFLKFGREVIPCEPIGHALATPGLAEKLRKTREKRSRQRRAVARLLAAEISQSSERAEHIRRRAVEIPFSVCSFAAKNRTSPRSAKRYLHARASGSGCASRKRTLRRSDKSQGKTMLNAQPRSENRSNAVIFFINGSISPK